MDQLIKISRVEGGGAVPYLKMMGNCFWHFSDATGFLFMCPTQYYWPSRSAERISLSLSHLVPEIIWHKVGLFFHKNLSFDTFDGICTNFLHDFHWALHIKSMGQSINSTCCYDYIMFKSKALLLWLSNSHPLSR